LDAEKHRQRHGARGGCQREQPRWCRWGLRDRADGLNACGIAELAGAKLFRDTHRGDDAIHVDAGGIGLRLKD
jgi:hypothetical protein